MAAAAAVCADNGAYELRIGTAGAQSPLVLPNVVARVRGDLKELVGEETEAPDLAHHSQLEYRRAHARGLLVDLATEEKVWERALGRLDCSRSELIVSESPLVPRRLGDEADQLFFETLGFNRVARLTANSLAALAYSSECAAEPFAQAPCRVVVDVGYSATWVTPMFGATVISACARRLDIGGKLLTNLLKEELSWRHFNLMDETFLVEQIKTQTCYVAKDFPGEISRAPSAVLEYLLPDYCADFRGRLVVENEVLGPKRQKLRLAQERFTVPEVVFDPARIYLRQAGLAEVVAQAISELPAELQGCAFENILVVGGTARLPGLVDRLARELQPWAPQGSMIKLVDCSSDSLLAWRGARVVANDRDRFFSVAVSKKEYLEVGSSANVPNATRGVMDM